MIDATTGSYVNLQLKDDDIVTLGGIVKELMLYKKRAGYFKRLNLSPQSWGLIEELDSMFNPKQKGGVTNYEQRLEPVDEDFD